MQNNREVIKTVEKHLYGYHDLKKKIADRKLDMILSAPAQQEIRNKQPSDPTGRIVLRMSADHKLDRWMKIILAVDISLVSVEYEKRKVIEYKYFMHPDETWENVADLHYVDVRTLRNWKSYLVHDIATRLGYYY